MQEFWYADNFWKIVFTFLKKNCHSAALWLYAPIIAANALSCCAMDIIVIYRYLTLHFNNM